MTRRELILVGPHGSGKSTLGRALARRWEVPFDHELGDELARRRRSLDPHAVSCGFGSAFDDEILASELQRDAAALSSRATGGLLARIVETWHPGNAAYAIVRARPRDPSALIERCVETVGRYPSRVLIQRLTITPATFLRRYSEGGREREATHRQFLQEVSPELDKLLVELADRTTNVVVLPPLATDEISVEACCDAIEDAVGREA